MGVWTGVVSSIPALPTVGTVVSDSLASSAIAESGSKPSSMIMLSSTAIPFFRK